MNRLFRRRAGTALLAALVVALTASGLVGCGGQIGGERAGGPGEAPPPARGPGAEPAPEVVRAYEQAGMLTNVGAFPFVGSIAYFAGATPDSTLALITLSFANRVLTFTREGEGYRAEYEARVEVTREGAIVRTVVATHGVRVPTFPETARATESVIFQQSLILAPGSYTVTVFLRDRSSPRATSKTFSVTVPTIGPTSLSTPVVVYQAAPRTQTDSEPHLVARPRATATFGRDTVVDLYLEGYGEGADLPIAVAVRTGASASGTDTATVWSDTIALPRHGAVFSGVAVVPLARVGIGPAWMIFHRTDVPNSDTVRTPIFVGFGEDIPVGSYDEMLNYLKYFPAHDRVEALRTVPPAERPAAWAQFVRVTDPIPSTPENEALQNYFQRLRQSNERFVGEGVPGWETDRGMVFMSIGEPDQSLAQGDMRNLRLLTRGQQQIWTYRQYNMQLSFEDVDGHGRYKLTSRSLSQFQALLKRIQGSPTAAAPKPGT
jgi:GWxTD domain-containing protein